MIPFTIPGPSVQSDWADDTDDDPLAGLDLQDPAPGVPTETARTRSRTLAGPTARPRFVGTATVAALLGVALDTVRRMIRDGRLRAVKWGSSPQAKWRVPVEELDRLGDAPAPAGDL